jgi:predicted LPLAT superfamily acyltransferase
MSTDWKGRPEAGSRFAISIALLLARTLGRGFVRVLLYPSTAYFFLRRGAERRGSRAFLTRAMGRPATTWQVLRNMHVYAQTMLDRIFLLSESLQRFDISSHGLDVLETQMARGRGVLLLGAHIGSFEVLRTLGEKRPGVRVAVVMDRRQTQHMTQMLHTLNPKIAANVIDAGADPAELALAMHAAAEEGALIGLLADRARPGEAVQTVDFFGAPADFPTGPYLIAALLELPVVLCFGLYRGGNRYDLYFESFAEQIRLVRGERVAQLGAWAQRYARRLEHYTRLDPYNWFNFYDFWHRRADPAAVRSESASVARGDA